MYSADWETGENHKNFKKAGNEAYNEYNKKALTLHQNYSAEGHIQNVQLIT